MNITKTMQEKYFIRHHNRPYTLYINSRRMQKYTGLLFKHAHFVCYEFKTDFQFKIFFKHYSSLVFKS